MGDLVISAGLDTENLPKTLKLIMRELKRLTEKPPAKAELRRVCDYVTGQIDLGLEGTESQMNWLGEQLLAYGTVISPEVIKSRLRKVTPGDIQAAARDFFRPNSLNLSLVSPLRSSKEISGLLKI